MEDSFKRVVAGWEESIGAKISALEKQMDGLVSALESKRLLE